MSNRHCPTCGEEYSDTYRTCPFCEEEAAIRRGKPLRRRGGKRVEKRQNDRRSGAGGVMLLLTAVIILGVVSYVFFDEQITGTLGIRTDSDVGGARTEDPPPPPQAAPGGPAGVGPPGTGGGARTPPPRAGEDDPAAPEVTEPGAGDAPVSPAEPLALSQPAFTIRAGETARLTASGGGGAVSWTSSNPGIATVDSGAVTGVAGGTVTITAASGEETAVCQVTVEGDPWVNPNAANIRLNKTDFTLYAKDPDVTMKVKGTDSPVVWASGNTGVVTIDANGVVKWVGKGNTTITATVDGVTLECIVRAK